MMKRKFWAVALSLVAVLCLAFALVCMLVCMAIAAVYLPTVAYA